MLIYKSVSVLAIKLDPKKGIDFINALISAIGIFLK